MERVSFLSGIFTSSICTCTDVPGLYGDEEEYYDDDDNDGEKENIIHDDDEKENISYLILTSARYIDRQIYDKKT